MSSVLFLLAAAVLILIGFAVVLILIAAMIDLLRSLRDDGPEELPDPEVVRYLRPRGNVDVIEEEAAEE